ncbi:acyl-CoA dehydrogenase [Paucibacter sp. APW11]|uniref:Acyl-CoA dehydrogenase n=1 Tax=Roseateles aquae TaxID=3077235 RepID=A0ABU3P575_9BURK|nr:acyl-CoA dehydrogenase [Paucibacter sp. APW11]MDT8997737.1 acyl-CoA dehydrogenase [Paucibacter sp. APW11]
MDFSPHPLHARLVADIRRLAPALHDTQLGERDRLALFSRDLWGVLCRARLHVLPAADSFGGQAAGAAALAQALEALGEHCEDTGLVFALAAHLCACVHPLVAHGSAEQQALWLPRIAEQGWIGAHAITEEEAGSDVNAMRTMAVREGDGYRIDGVKRYITNAPVCDFVLVHARTADKGSFLDFSTFILPRNAPGLKISKQPHEKIGLRTTAMGDIHFEGVHVSEAQRIGAQGSGGPIFQASMELERTCLFAMYLGVMQRQLRLSCQRAEGRVQFGQALIEQQAVSHRLADMKLRLEAARLATARAAWSLDHPPADPSASAIAKLLVSEASIRNGLDALQIHGASGVLSGDIERQLRNALPSSLFSGTTEVLKNHLVRQLRAECRRATRAQAVPGVA